MDMVLSGNNCIFGYFGRAQVVENVILLSIVTLAGDQKVDTRAAGENPCDHG
jgi:hypothetical protein